MRALTRKQVREVDRIAIEEYGIPGIVLMENAALGVARRAVDILNQLALKPADLVVSIICGGGNNGGDGYALARHLHILGYGVKIYAVSDPEKLSGDAAINRRIIERIKVPCALVLDQATLDKAADEWRGAHLLVDAILGTGFIGELRPHVAAVIEKMNALAGRVGILSVDLPSGLDCDTGQPSHPTVRASETVTFAALKVGFDNPAAREFLGRVYVEGIGAPPEIISRVQACVS